MILTKTNPMPQDVGPLQNQHHLEMLRDRNLGPCWHGKNPTENLPPRRLSRTQQAPQRQCHYFDSAPPTLAQQ